MSKKELKELCFKLKIYNSMCPEREVNASFNFAK